MFRCAKNHPIIILLVGYFIDIYIRDSGKGISSGVRAKMLEPFFSTKKGKGSGLGLPFIKGIAKKHHGDLIFVENSPNTTFMLELPKHLQATMQ